MKSPKPLELVEILLLRFFSLSQTWYYTGNIQKQAEAFASKSNHQKRQK